MHSWPSKGTLLQDLTNNITLEDLEQLKSACKEDIPVRRVRRSLLAVPGLASWRATISWTKTAGHIFEISCRPDLLTMVVDYRTRVLKISEKMSWTPS